MLTTLIAWKSRANNANFTRDRLRKLCQPPRPALLGLEVFSAFSQRRRLFRKFLHNKTVEAALIAFCHEARCVFTRSRSNFEASAPSATRQRFWTAPPFASAHPTRPARAKNSQTFLVSASSSFSNCFCSFHSATPLNHPTRLN